MSKEKTHVLYLNDYQAANLLWCLDAIMYGWDYPITWLDTGDWCGEIKNMLDELDIETEPNGRD